MKQYLIKLTPLDIFFFGTGKEFGTNNQNYYIKSSYLPQQTTLLGMLRYELLKNAGKNIFDNNKIKDFNEAKKLIGEKSFIFKEEKKDKDNYNDFGKINSISSVFLMKGNVKLFPQSKEYQKKDKINEGQKTEYKYLNILFKDDLPYFENYNPKSGIIDTWADNSGNMFEYKDIFTELIQTGIKKPKFKQGQKENNKAFYVHSFYRMEKDFCFAFYANVDNSINLKNSIVVMGGERQPFQMEVCIEKEDNEYNYQPSSVDKAILLSDAYISENLNNICDFAITETVNFRCLQAHIEKTKKYYSIKRKEVKQEDYKKENVYKSNELQLYKKGSVFYFKTKEKQDAFENAIKSEKGFQKIGYNNYKIQNKSL